MNISSPCRLALLVASVCVVQQASAQVVLLGNYPPGATGPGTTIGSGVAKAVAFTMPAQDYNISSVVLRLSDFVLGEDANISFRADNAGDPGAVVGTLADTPGAGSTAEQDFTFSPAGTLTLEAGERYWLVIAADSGNFSWRVSNVGSGVAPTGLATDPAYEFFNGTTWTSSSTFNSFQINAVAVPEPVHYTMGGAIALLGFAAFRRYRNQAA